MNNRVLYGLFVLGIVSAAAGAGTYAFFNDTETSMNNTFESGTVDVAIDGENPWNTTYVLEDMKPSYVKWLNFSITNVGNNTVKLYKHINVTNESDGLHPEAEDEEDPAGTRNNISDVIDFSLRVNGSPLQLNGFATCEDCHSVGDVSSWWIPLGELEPGETMNVSQDFHMRDSVTNWAQGDTMTFDEEILALQLNAPDPVPIPQHMPPSECPAETPQPWMDVLSVDSSGFPKMYAYVHVDTPDGRGGNLTAADFEVWERVDGNCTQQTIESFNFTEENVTSKADVLVVFDDTGSMFDEITEMQNAVTNFTDAMNASGIDARYSLVSFKDVSEIDQNWTSNASEFKDAVDALSASGGGDTPEDNFDAIMLGENQSPGWRPDAQKVIIDITDAPSHVPTRSDHGINNVSNEIGSEGIFYVAISPNTTGSSQKKTLANMTGGRWFDITATPDLGDIISDVTGILTSQYAIDWTTTNPTPDGTSRDVIIIVDDPTEGTGSDTGGYTAPTP